MRYTFLNTAHSGILLQNTTTWLHSCFPVYFFVLILVSTSRLPHGDQRKQIKQNKLILLSISSRILLLGVVNEANEAQGS